MGRASSRRGRRSLGSSRREPAVRPTLIDTPQPDGDGAPSRRVDRTVAVGAGVALLVIVLVVVLSGGDDRADDELPGDDDPPTTTGAVIGDAPAGPVVITMDSTSPGSDVVTISASSGGGGRAPWVAFELCGLDPPGCVPVWTEGLRQVGATYFADVAVPDGFVAPDGYAHTCETVGACELRVTTAATSVAFAVGSESGSAPPDETPPIGAGGPEVDLRPGVVADGERTEVVVRDAPPGEALDVALCPDGVPDERCTPVQGYRADDSGNASFRLDVPRMMSGHVATSDGIVAREVDCADETCRLRVSTSTGSTAVPVRFDAEAPTRPAPTAGLDRGGPFDVGTRVIVEGDGFPRFGSRGVDKVRWVLCDDEPAAPAAVGHVCGTPRVVQATALGPEGSFLLAVRVPDPTSIRTWVDNEALECDPRCWLVVMVDPFPRPVSIPIEIGR